MTNIEGKIPIDTLKQAGAVQAARSASTDAPLHGIFCQMFDCVASTAAGQLRICMLSCFPEIGYVAQPQISGFHIDGALPNVVLNIGVCCLVLRSYVFKRKFIGSFCRSHEGGGIVRNETC